MLPTLCRMIQLPCSTLGTSLNMLLRSWSALGPLPARKLRTRGRNRLTKRGQAVQ